MNKFYNDYEYSIKAFISGLVIGTGRHFTNYHKRVGTTPIGHFGYIAGHGLVILGLYSLTTRVLIEPEMKKVCGIVEKHLDKVFSDKEVIRVLKEQSSKSKI